MSGKSEIEIAKYLAIFHFILLAHIVLLVFLYFSQSDFLMPDSARYLDLSDSIRNGQFGLNTVRGYESESLRLPGYSAFILICQTLFGKSQSAIVLPQIVLYIFSVWAMAKAVEWNFGDVSSIIFLTLSLFFPMIAFDTLNILPDSISLFLISSGVFAISNPKWRKSIWSFVIAGLFLGLASYQRTNLFPVAFVFSTIIFVRFKEYRIHSIVLVSVIALMIFPWMVRNYSIFGSFLASSNNVGLETIIYQSSIGSRMAKDNGNLFRRNKVPDKYEDYENQEIQNQLSSIKKELNINPNESYFQIVFNLPPDKAPLAKSLLMQNAWENIKYSNVYFVTQGLTNIPRMWIAKADIIPNRFIYPPIIPMLFGLFVFFMAILGSLFIYKSTDENVRFLGLICVGSFLFFSLSLCFLDFETRYANPGKFLFLALSAYSIYSLFQYGFDLVFGESFKYL